MGYPTEIKADFPHQQNIYTSEFDKGSKNMPLGKKAVANAKEPAQLAVVSEFFYNGDISQSGGLRGSTGYGKNTTQYRPKKSSNNKDNNQESNSEFDLGLVYKDLENKIAEALSLIPIKENQPKDSNNRSARFDLQNTITSGFNISWNRKDKHNLVATVNVFNATDLNILKSKLDNMYEFSFAVDNRLYTKKNIKNKESEALNFYNVAVEFDFTTTFLHKRKGKDINKKIYNRKDKKNAGTQEYAEYVALESERNEKIDYIHDLLKKTGKGKDYFSGDIDAMTFGELEELDLKELILDSNRIDRLIIIYDLLKKTGRGKDYFSGDIDAMSAEELLAINIVPLEDIVDSMNNYAEVSLDEYYRKLYENIDCFEEPKSDRLIIENNNIKKTPSDVWNDRELELKEVKKLKGRQDLEERIQSIKDYALFSKKDRIQLLRDYTSFSKKDRETQDMEPMGHLILDGSNIAKLFEYLKPSGQKQVHINKFASFIAKHNLWGKSFKDVSNAIFHIK